MKTEDYDADSLAKTNRETGQLTVFNKGGAWAHSVNAAITTFNNLPFKVGLVAAKEEKSANVVVILASGPQHYTRDGNIVKTDSSFKFNQFHGLTITLADGVPEAIFFAVIFLPGKLPNPAKGQKEVVIVHDLFMPVEWMNMRRHPPVGSCTTSWCPATAGCRKVPNKATPCPQFASARKR